MSTIILGLVLAAMVGLGFLAVFVTLLIGMRTEGRHLSPSGAPQSRMAGMARRISGLYVRRELEKRPARGHVRR